LPYREGLGGSRDIEKNTEKIKNNKAIFKRVPVISGRL